MAEITEVVLPKPRNPWEKDLIMALYTLISQMRTSSVGDGTIVLGNAPLYISETLPNGTITSGSIWVKTSARQAYMYVIDTWVPLAGS
mgnify:CR=1 FL=1